MSQSRVRRAEAEQRQSRGRRSEAESRGRGRRAETEWQKIEAKYSEQGVRRETEAVEKEKLESQETRDRQNRGRRGTGNENSQKGGGQLLSPDATIQIKGVVFQLRVQNKSIKIEQF